MSKNPFIYLLAHSASQIEDELNRIQTEKKLSSTLERIFLFTLDNG